MELNPYTLWLLELYFIFNSIFLNTDITSRWTCTNFCDIPTLNQIRQSPFHGNFAYIRTKLHDFFLCNFANLVIDNRFNSTHTGLNNNQIKRGDIEGVKIGAGTHKRLTDVPFRITSKTTGLRERKVHKGCGECSSPWSTASKEIDA